MPIPGVTTPKRTSYPGTREDMNGRNKLSRSKPPLTALNSTHPASKKNKSRSNSISSVDGKSGGISGFFKRFSAPPTPTEDTDKSVDEKGFAKALSSLLSRKGKRESLSDAENSRMKEMSLAEAYLPTSPIYHDVTLQERQAEKDKVVRLEERSERRKSGVSQKDKQEKYTSTGHSPVPEVPMRSEKRPISQGSMQEPILPEANGPSLRKSKLSGIYDQPGRLLVHGHATPNRESPGAQAVGKVASTSTTSLDEHDGYFPAVPRSTLDITKDTQRVNGTSTQTSDYSVSNSGTEDEHGDGRRIAVDGREDFRNDANKTPRRRRNSPPPVSFYNRYRPEDFEEPPRPSLPGPHPLLHRSSKFSEGIEPGKETADTPSNQISNDPQLCHALTTEKAIILGSTDGIIPTTSARHSLDNSAKSAQAQSNRTSTVSQHYGAYSSDGNSKMKSPQTRPTTADSSDTPASRNSLRSITDNESFMGGWRLKQALQAALEAQNSNGGETATPLRLSADIKNEDTSQAAHPNISSGPGSTGETEHTPANLTALPSISTTTGISENKGSSSRGLKKDETVGPKIQAKGDSLAQRSSVLPGTENMVEPTLKKEVNAATSDGASSPSGTATPTRKKSRRLIKRRSRPGSVADLNDEKLKAAIAKGKEKALKDIAAHQSGKSSWSLRSGSSTAITDSSAVHSSDSSLKAPQIAASSTVSISSDASNSSAFPASSSNEHSPPGGVRIPTPQRPQSQVRPKTPTSETRRPRPASMQIPPSGGFVISPNKSPIKAPKAPTFPATAGVPVVYAQPGVPVFPQPAGVPISSIKTVNNSIPPVPPIPASQRQSYSNRKDTGKAKVVSPLRNEIRGSPDSAHPKNMGILTPHLKRTPSSGSALSTPNGLKRTPSNGGSLSTSNGTNGTNGLQNGANSLPNPNLKHRKSHSSPMPSPLPQTHPVLPNGTQHHLNNPTSNYFSSPPHQRPTRPTPLLLLLQTHHPHRPPRRLCRPNVPQSLLHLPRLLLKRSPRRPRPKTNSKAFRHLLHLLLLARPA